MFGIGLFAFSRIPHLKMTNGRHLLIGLDPGGGTPILDLTEMIVVTFRG